MIVANGMSPIHISCGGCVSQSLDRNISRKRATRSQTLDPDPLQLCRATSLVGEIVSAEKCCLLGLGMHFVEGYVCGTRRISKTFKSPTCP